MAQMKINGKRVRELRELQEYTLDDLGKYCGCSRQRINQIESGQSCVMEKDKLNKMAYFLGCTPDYLVGLVEHTDEIAHRSITENALGELFIENTPVKLALKPGDFRSSLLQKILCLEPERMYRLDSILDLFASAEDNDLESFERYFSALLSSKPQYSKTVPDTKFYIYNRLCSHIIPKLCEDAHDFIYSSKIAASIQECDMEDKDFTNHLDQQLGDFQKETKHKFHQKIRNAVVGHKNKNSSVFSVSKTDLDEIMENVANYFYILVHEKMTNDKHLIKSLPNTKSEHERQAFIQNLNKYLMRFIQSYSNDVISELKNFLNFSKDD